MLFRSVRVVTAGTLTEDVLLDAKASNWLVAVVAVGEMVGLAAADVSTGAFELCEVSSPQLEAEIARYAPSEILCSPAEAGALAAKAPASSGAQIVPREQRDFDSTKGEAKLKSLHDVATLDGFGAFTRAELAAAGGLLAYLDHAGKGTLPFLAPPVRRTTAEHMAIDAATRESLELTQAAGGGRKGSLLDTIDRTVTGAGARMQIGRAHV